MAQMPFSPCPPNSGPCTDVTVGMLERIFGDVITALTTGGDPNSVNVGGNILAAMFQTYNSGILILASLVVSYIAIMGVANTANDGEAMGKTWSSVWTPVRIVFGGTILLPTTSGYSFIQLIVLMFSLWGIGFANQLYKTGVSMGVISPNGLVQGVNAPGNYYGLREFAKQYMAVSYCARSTNIIFAATGGGSSPQVQVNGGTTAIADRVSITNGRTDSTYYVKDRNLASNLAGGLPFCGTINISSYVAQPMTDSTSTALEQMHELVQKQKIIVVVDMMKAIDQWVNTWPSDINKTGWGSVDSNEFNRIVQNYENQIPAKLISAVDGKKDTVNAGMTAALNALTQDGWASAGGWFQRVGMVRGQISGILSAPVGSVTAPSISGLPFDMRSILLASSVATMTDAINKKAEEKEIYINSKTPKPEDMAGLIPKDASSNINPSEIRANMDAKMSSFVNSSMLSIVEMATGANGNGTTPLCGSAGQMGGSLNRMKCIGDYLSVAHLGIATADVLIKTGATALRVLAGSASGVKVLGTGVELDKVVTPLWDWIIEVPIKQLGILSSYIQPLAFYFGVFLPSLPYTIFMIVVAGWLLAVLQSVIASTLWSMMHMTPDKTFVGSQSQGYLLLLSLLMRPPLAVLGLFAAVLISDPMIDYIAKGFFSMRGAIVTSTGGVGAIAEFMTFAWWMIVFGATLLPVLYMTYGLPQILPDHVLKWIGAGLGDLGETGAVNSMRGNIASAGSRTGATDGNSSPKLKFGGGGGGSGGGGGIGGGGPSKGGNMPISTGPQGIASGGGSQSGSSPKAADSRSFGNKLGEGAGIALGRGITGVGAAIASGDMGGVKSAMSGALSEGKKAYNEGAASRLASYKADRQGGGGEGNKGGESSSSDLNPNHFQSGEVNPPTDSADDSSSFSSFSDNDTSAFGNAEAFSQGSNENISSGNSGTFSQNLDMQIPTRGSD